MATNQYSTAMPAGLYEQGGWPGKKHPAWKRVLQGASMGIYNPDNRFLGDENKKLIQAHTKSKAAAAAGDMEANAQMERMANFLQQYGYSPQDAAKEAAGAFATKVIADNAVNNADTAAAKVNTEFNTGVLPGARAEGEAKTGSKIANYSADRTEGQNRDLKAQGKQPFAKSTGSAAGKKDVVQEQEQAELAGNSLRYQQTRAQLGIPETMAWGDNARMRYDLDKTRGDNEEYNEFTTAARRGTRNDRLSTAKDSAATEAAKAEMTSETYNGPMGQKLNDAALAREHTTAISPGQRMLSPIPLTGSVIDGQPLSTGMSRTVQEFDETGQPIMTRITSPGMNLRPEVPAAASQQRIRIGHTNNFPTIFR